MATCRPGERESCRCHGNRPLSPYFLPWQVVAGEGGDGAGAPAKGLTGVPPCINSTAQINWLNRGDVRKALHIPDTLPSWDICRWVRVQAAPLAQIFPPPSLLPPSPGERNQDPRGCCSPFVGL